MADNFNTQPLYNQIKEDILGRVVSGEIAPGDKLPSEADLAQRYGVNRFTVRHAMIQLVNEGVIFRVPGRGTYITQHPLTGGTPPVANSHDMRACVMLIIPNLGNSFTCGIVDAVQTILDKNGYDTVLRSVHTNPYEERSALQRVTESGVVGLIHLAAAFTRTNLPLLDALRTSMPVVLLDMTAELPIDSIISDDVKGAYNITSHLIEIGHRRILHLAGAEGASTTTDRLAGYREALEAHGCQYDPALVRATDWDIEGGYCETKKAFLSRTADERPTAIFACSDYAALGAYRALIELGLSIPDDVAVVGFGNLDVARYVCPRLTSVDQSPYDMGKVAAHLMLDRLSGARSADEVSQIVVPSKIISRESCGIRSADRQFEPAPTAS